MLPLCKLAHELAGASTSISIPVVDRFTGGALFVNFLPPSHSLYSAVPPFLPQLLVRVLPIEKNLCTLYDGGEAGAGLLIEGLVLFGLFERE